MVISDALGLAFAHCFYLTFWCDSTLAGVCGFSLTLVVVVKSFGRRRWWW